MNILLFAVTREKDVYKRQINSILSPVVQGTAKMLEAETLDMKDRKSVV